MGSLKPILRALVLILAITGTHQQVKIKCYDCVTPLGVNDAMEYCNASIYCKGVYCTKGPNAQSNGIYHGCINSPPVDKAGASCKNTDNQFGFNKNCYCKNIDYCNETAPLAANIVLIALLILVTWLTTFF
ncbi:hypothetical protein B9Z55_022815 [Caenorhabditis nigoni]|uniref:UPAR/Ly6 domain-containing protein n=1 Tax=Caenorhabditis nigoni TaxID=1611254 RepID=A0A2G5SLU2_9PELO|nr:hypothetical protein B9Z55_022815 [Caenorhabditis nigoni]